MNAYAPIDIGRKLNNLIETGYSPASFAEHISKLARAIEEGVGAGIRAKRFGSQFYLYESVGFQYFSELRIVGELRKVASVSEYQSTDITRAKLTLIKAEFDQRIQRVRELSLIGEFDFEDPADQFEAELGINWRTKNQPMDIARFEEELRFTRTSIEFFGSYRAGSTQSGHVTGLSNAEPFITIGGTIAAIGGFVGLVKLVQDNIEKFYRIKKIMLDTEAAGMHLEAAREAADQAKLETARKVAELLADGQAKNIDHEAQARIQNIAEGVLDRLVNGMRVGISTTADDVGVESENEALGLSERRLVALRHESPFELPPFEVPKKLLGGPQESKLTDEEPDNGSDKL